MFDSPVNTGLKSNQKSMELSRRTYKACVVRNDDSRKGDWDISLYQDVNWLLCTLFQEMIYHPRQHRILVQVDQMWYSLNLFLFVTLLSSWRITLRHLDLLRSMKHKSFWVRYRVVEKGLWTTEGPLKVVWGHLGMWFAKRNLKQVIKKSSNLLIFVIWENENDICDQWFAFFFPLVNCARDTPVWSSIL